MKTISSIEDLVDLDINLTKFILQSCPWITEGWDPESMGYVFLLDDNDRHKVSSICTFPHIPEDETEYRESMAIDLATFDLWEAPAYHDPTSGYWNVVAIIGQEYGCVLFLSAGFVESIPALHEKLLDIQEHIYNF